MDNVLLTVILAVSFLQFTVIALFFLKFFGIIREIVAFITPAGDNLPSPAAELWKSMSKTLMLEFKTSFMGMLSVQSKIEKRAQDEAVQEAVTKTNPLAGAALAAFPKLQKLILKNPAILEFAMSKVASAAAKSAPGNNHDGGGFAERLGRYA